VLETGRGGGRDAIGHCRGIPIEELKVVKGTVASLGSCFF
jgi:hypothetical protein